MFKHVVAAVLVLAGCQDGSRVRRFSVFGTGSYHDFVFHSLVIDPYGAPPYVDKPTNLPAAAGFNWDGLYSPDVAAPSKCNWGDRQADVDFDQNLDGCSPLPTCGGGVDNVLPVLADAYDALRADASETTARAYLGSELAAGHVVWLLRIESAENLVEDATVQVTLLHGFFAESSCSSLFTGAGHFIVADDSLNATGAAKWTAWGSIFGGRLDVQFPSGLALLPSPVLDGTVSAFRLRVTLAGDGLSGQAGNAGARIAAEPVYQLWTSKMEFRRTALNGLLPNLVDLPTAAGGCSGSFANPVGQYGVGIRFNLAHANLDDVGAAPPLGACGS